MYTVFEIGEKTETERKAFEFALELGLVSLLNRTCAFGSRMSGYNSKSSTMLRHFCAATKSCRKRVSIFENSIFERSKLQISQI
jgi:hypothetical protein